MLWVKHPALINKCELNELVNLGLVACIDVQDSVEEIQVMEEVTQHMQLEDFLAVQIHIWRLPEIQDQDAQSQEVAEGFTL